MSDVPPGMIELPMSMAEALHVLNQAGIVVQEATGGPCVWFFDSTGVKVGSIYAGAFRAHPRDVVNAILEAAKSIRDRREPSKSSKPYQATLRRQSRTIKRRKLQTAKAAPRVARLSGPSCSGLAY